MRNEYKTNNGLGHEILQPTCSDVNNNLSNPHTKVSRASGTATVATGTPATITFTTKLLNIPAIGDTIFCYGFTNAGNNGRFTVTAATSTVVSFTNASAVNEALSLSAAGNVSIIHTPNKVYQDVSFTSGTPNYAEITAASGTCSALAGVYSYISIFNNSDVDAIIDVAGGKLFCETGASLSHEVKPFSNDVTVTATGYGSGNIIINIT